jgi:hypothetical protein
VHRNMIMVIYFWCFSVTVLKGTVARDFRPTEFFINQLVLIHGLKPFCIWPNIRRKNRQYSNFSGVNVPAETISARSLTPPNRFQWGHWPRWNYQNFSYKKGIVSRKLYIQYLLRIIHNLIIFNTFISKSF